MGHYAVKMMSKKFIESKRQIQAIYKERDILMRLRHPGIIRMHWCFQDKKNLYYVMQLAPNGDLATLLKREGQLNFK